MTGDGRLRRRLNLPLLTLFGLGLSALNSLTGVSWNTL